MLAVTIIIIILITTQMQVLASGLRRCVERGHFKVKDPHCTEA